MPDQGRTNRAHIARGRWGEDRAARHLGEAGYRVLDRNWRSPERDVRGELDLVLGCGDGVVFCEVKARRTCAAGSAAAAVGEAKQGRIRALAESWLRLASFEPAFVRFDVIAIDGVRLTHLVGAF